MDRPIAAPAVSWWARVLPPVLTFATLVAVWWLAGRRFRPDQLPSPLDVLKALHELASSGALVEHVGVSLGRLVLAYGLAVLAGIPAGLLLGWYALSLRAVGPLLQVLRPISPIAWFPLAVLWFGVGNAPAVFIIFLAALFPILLTTVQAVHGVPAGYLRLADNFGAPRWMLFSHIIVPASFPAIAIGLRIAVGTAWIQLVAGEMLGAQSGLGFLINDARNFLRTDQVLGGMVVIGLLGLGMDRLMSVGERAIRRRWGAS
jgi:NitT/TauT family transport system permease protein